LNWKYVIVFELKSGKNNVFDLAELYLYLISKCIFGPNPEDSCYQVVELVATKQQYSETQTILHQSWSTWFGGV